MPGGPVSANLSLMKTIRAAIFGTGFMGRVHTEAARRLGIKVPILLDPNGKVAASYGVYYTPMTFIIDMDGKVDQRLMGAANWADKTVVDYINRLIAQGQEKK